MTESTPREEYSDPPIYKAIETLDREGMDLIAKGDYDEFANYIDDTGNTICGRYFSKILSRLIQDTLSA